MLLHDQDANGKIVNKKAMKTYVIEIQQGSAVYLQKVKMAPIEEYYLDPPSLEEIEKNSISTKELKHIVDNRPGLKATIAGHQEANSTFKSKFHYLWSKYVLLPYYLFKARQYRRGK